MKAVRTVDDKADALKKRKEEQRQLGKHIDNLLEQGARAQEGESIGCAGQGVCPALGRSFARFFGISKRVSAVSTQELDAVVVDMASSTETAASSLVKVEAKKKEHSELSKRVFGIQSKKVSPESKLAAVGASMKTRAESLESKAEQARKSAHDLMKCGNKAAAMRELKKSKAYEKQAASTHNVMDALEAQSDMLAQTALQKEVADALGATAKSLKKEKNLISKAEDAVDAASEMRDLHEDLVSVMGGLGDVLPNDFDDDDLLSELQDMLETGRAEDESTEREELAELTEVELAQQDANTIEQRDEAFKVAQATRRKFPSAPKSKVSVERQGLLATQ